MKPHEVADYLLNFPEASEGQPFGPDVDVYRVVEKIFAIFSPDSDPPRLSLKCEPLLAIELREEYEAVNPGYHLNKDHWNTVTLDGTVPTRELKSMMNHSFEQVVKSLPKAKRETDSHRLI